MIENSDLEGNYVRKENEIDFYLCITLSHLWQEQKENFMQKVIENYYLLSRLANVCSFTKGGILFTQFFLELVVYIHLAVNKSKKTGYQIEIQYPVQSAGVKTSFTVGLFACTLALTALAFHRR
jgi:hypothetical protein